jgi:hypothetical protein
VIKLMIPILQSASFVEINYEEGIEGLLVIKVYRKHNKNEKSTIPILRIARRR